MTSPSPAVSRDRLRLIAVCLIITLLVFTQSSALIAADTKFDLVVAPWHFLATAASAWDPTSDAGTLQNQAYGYLFPMGPFFALGHLVHLTPWVIQRSWESVLLVVAFLGVFRLSRLLGIAGWWPRVAAGLVYALAPRMLMEIGIISSELLPVVVAPWVLIPLVRGSRAGAYGGSARRAAALSGVALLFAGGTNAAATLAILPIPILWLLTRERGPRRAALMRWWALAVGLACLWWTVPLLVLGKYSPPFLNWIESAAVTTGPTSLATTLRGAEHWEAYLGKGVWPAGYIFVTERSVIFATALVAAAGLFGLSRRGSRHRLFLALCLATGLVLTTFGHVASIGPVLALTERNALNGGLNAFRNVHKFDPVIRLPLALGVGQLVAMSIARWRRRSAAAAGTPRRTWDFDPRPTFTVAALCIAVAAVAPAVTGTLIPELHTVNEPNWWVQAADWLGHQGDGRALVVPGAAQPIYIWGSPRDDALQPVAKSPWSARNSIPLAQAGYIRLLDEIDSDLAAGRDDPTLSPVLARSGVRYVVVRNDLDVSASDATPLRYIYATLENSAGFREVANFGPGVIPATNPNELIDDGTVPSQAAITVFENVGWSGAAALLPLSQAVAANGSADNLTDLTAAGVTPDQPVIFAPSVVPMVAGTEPPLTAMSDGVRRREFGFGSIDHYSDTMTATQPYTTKRAAHDYLPSPAPALSTTSYLGISDVQASSSGAGATALVNVSPANGPWSALDGDPTTAWRVGSIDGAIGQWLQVDLRAPINTTQASVTFAGANGVFPDLIRVDTSTGHLDEAVTPDGAPQTIRIPSGATRFVRLTFLGATGRGNGAAAGIAELSLPSVLAARSLVVPGASRPGLIAFSVADGYRGECLTVNGQPVCDPTWVTAGEEDNSLARTFALSKSATYDTQATVRLRPGTSLDQLLDRGEPLRALASSVNSDDPRQRAGAAVDGDLTTGWTAAVSDLKPTLTISTRRPHLLNAVELTPLATGVARAPVEVEVTAGGETVDRVLPASGIARLDYPVRTRTVSIHVVRASLRITTSSITGKSEFLPVGIAEVNLLGRNEPIPLFRSDITLSCGAGLSMVVDGTTMQLHVKALSATALGGAALTARPCPTPGSLALHLPAAWMLLGAGPHRITLNATDVTDPQSLVLAKVGQPARPAPIALPLRTLSWSASSRSVEVHTTAAALLVVHENENAGWQATFNGVTLSPVTVDGWQQAWVVPSGTDGVVHLRFTPQTAFRAGLIGGAGAAVLLLGLTLPLPSRWQRRSRRRPVGTTAPAALVRWALVLGTLALLGSVSGLVIGAILIVVEVATPSVLRDRVTTWALGITVGAAIVAETAATAAARHPLAGSAGVQVLCLAAIGIVLVRCLVPRDRPPGAGEPTQ